ncbi:type VI secretion system baseplate subunit TssF [Geomesophilobacter sediminis]|uniref:Type VI secretion system baseplate subunit TssF n=1 Tax=Geomesophilobacter sediminis TaxID=2798584 RepID=A0A8J7IXD2_9BACT|nr:type VI secretion system baseplate subunit TssF [Geomesophilobacter sediminis]MBJ6724517.1 type VI secretion system baseplate subunit TssF [Geomesophilobacter sediminis]
MTMRYFQEELALLKELASEFAAAHPALAPMLGGPYADADVERLFEGVAFQNALLREKLEDDFPELINDLALLLCPQFLRPIPATTTVAFSPHPSMAKPLTIPAGAQLGSLPIDGTSCLFRTCWSIQLHPLELLDATFAQPAGTPPAVVLSCQLNGITLDDWQPEVISFFLCNDYPAASNLYSLLRRQLRRIVIAPEAGGRAVELPPDCLVERGLAGEDAVIPYLPEAFPGYRLIQEYFLVPQRFLFLDLVGWECWIDRGSGSRFTVRLELESSAGPAQRITRDNVVLFAVPAVNLFCHDAVPVRLDHRKERYRVRPEGLTAAQAQVFSVDKVFGLSPQGSRKRCFRPFHLFGASSSDEPVFHTSLVKSPVSGALDHFVSVTYPASGSLPEPETLSIAITCTNGSLAERLRVGDLSHATGLSPEFTSFRNVTPVTPAVMPPLGENSLWRLVSLLALNGSSLESAEKLRTLLALLLFDEQNRDRVAVAANRKRIDSIEDLVARPAERLVRGVPIRGREISVRIRGDGFAGGGDLYLFGAVLERFLAGYATLNSFTRLALHDVVKGDTIQWQPRLGHQPLL